VIYNNRIIDKRKYAGISQIERAKSTSELLRRLFLL